MNTYSTPAPGPHYRIEREQAKQDYPLKAKLILDRSSRGRAVYAAIARYDLSQAYGAVRRPVARYYNWQSLEGVGADGAKILAATERFLAGGVQ